ncbi:MAG: choice-of-anchor J domain-containing protein [Bacteroidetes bacterium]|nr:choice-of-anchor J domain-containing protein [Bacteroidota bacterium]
MALALAAFTLLGTAKAQVAWYLFSQSSGTYTPITTGGGAVAAIAAGWDDNVVNVTIPSFSFNGVAYTAVNVNSNGYITFGATAPSSTSYTPISSSTAYAGAVSAFTRDLIDGDVGAQNPILQQTVGNEVVFQWTNAFRYSGGRIAGDALNFQIRLNTVTNVVSVVYGTCTATSTSLTGQVGLRGAANTDYNNRTTTTNWAATTAGTANSSTCTTSATVMPASGSTFTWTRSTCPRPTAPTATGLTPSGANIGWTCTGCTGSFILEYGPASTFTDPGAGATAGPNGIVVNPATAPQAIAGLTPSTQYRYFIRQDCGGGAFSNNSAAATFTTTAACPTVTSSAATSVTQTGANANWSCTSCTGSFIIEYGPSSTFTTPGTGTSPGTNGTVITALAGTTTTPITGLTPATAYRYFVRQDCTGAGFGYGLNSAGQVFTTACAAATMPFVQNFDAVTTPSLPSCFTKQTIAGNSSGWFTVNDALNLQLGYTGNVILYQYSSSSAANAWFFTPGFDLTAGVSYRLQYRYGNDGGSSYPEKMKVAYGTAANAAGMSLPIFDHGTISSTTNALKIVDFIPPSSGTYYIGFQAYSDADMDLLIVDDIRVKVTPTCNAPTPTVSNVTLNSADLSWTNNASESYNYEVRSSGDAGSGATGLVASGNVAGGPVALSGLVVNTRYTAYVQGVCESGTVLSDWSVGASFSAYCTPTHSATCGNGDITNVTFGPMTNTSTCGPTPYTFYPPSSVTASLNQSLSYDLSVTNSASSIISVWIDWDHDLQYEASEWTQVATASTAGAPATVTIAIPVDAPLGETYMRIRARNAGNTNGSGDACSSFGSGESEDYVFTVAPPPTCLAPTGIAASNVTFSTATINWTNNSSESYNYEVRSSGLPGSGATGLIQSGNMSGGPVAVSGLSASTTYMAYVQGICSGGSDLSSWSSAVTFFTGYCSATSTSTSFEKIGQVTVADIDNSSTSTAGYEDFSAVIGTMDAGGSYPVTVNITSSYTGDQVLIWIDANQDLDFDDPGELAFSLQPPTIGSAVPYAFTGTLSVPPTALAGQTRMRVRLHDTGGSPANSTPCGIAQYGQVEDYTLNITIPPCLPPSLTLSVLSATGVTISWTDNPLAAYEYEVRTSGAAGSGPSGLVANGTLTGSPMDATGLLTPNTSYTAYVRSLCDGGATQSAWAQLTFFTGYCTASATDMTNAGLLISNVAVADINNPTTAVIGYEDLTSVVGNVLVGQDYPLVITRGNNYSNDQVLAWVDWNQDLDFNDANELVLTSAINGPMSGTMHVPAGALPGPTRMRIRLHNTTAGLTANATPCGTSTVGQVEDYTLNVVVSTCVFPSDAAISSITTTGAMINWTAVGSNTYEYELRTSGAPGNPTGLVLSGTTASTNVDLSGQLTQNTAYRFYVRSVCTGPETSLWSPSLNFRSGCGVGNVPYSEDFGSLDPPPTALPYCYGSEVIGVSGGAWGTYFINGGAFQASSPVALCPNNTSAATDAWMFVRQLHLIGGTSYRLTYLYGNNGGASGLNLSVHYGASASAAAMTNPIVDHGAVLTIPNSGLTDFVPATTGDYYIGFHATGPAGAATFVAVENLVVDLSPPCIAPTAITVSGVTYTSATLNWTNSTAAEYEYELRTSGAAGSGATGLVATGIVPGGPVPLSGLTPNTSYTAYVRGVCDPITSTWAAPVSFVTGYCSVNATDCEENIGRVQMGALDHTSGLGCNGGYQDLTAHTGTLILGIPQPITVTLMTNGSLYSADSVSVFIDWNQDLDLSDAGEKYRLLSSDGSVHFTGTIDVPPTALAGPTRMRVRLTYNTAPLPCGTQAWGETEDYTVDVVITDCLPPTDLSVINITGTTADLTWTDNGAVSYDYEVRSSGAPESGPTGLAASGNVTGSPANVTDLTGLATYTAYIRANCDGPSTGPWMGVPFTMDCAGSTCNYSVAAYDLYGDGWNGGTVDVLVNHVVVATVGPEFSDCGPSITSFPVCETAPIAFQFTSDGGFFGFPEEMAMEVVDPFGTVLYAFRGDEPENGSGDCGAVTYPVTSNPLPTLGQVFFSSFGYCTPPACTTPENVAVGPIGASSATISWDCSGCTGTYLVEYGPAGFTPGFGDVAGGGTLVSAAASPVTIPGLSANTSYSVYVRQDCDGEGTSFSNNGIGEFATGPTCGDNFYDSGGPSGPYSNNENTLTSICPTTPGDQVRVIFSSTDWEGCCDHLLVFNNNANTGPSTEIVTGTTPTLSASNPSGCLTFAWSSDVSATGNGWAATVTCFTPNNTCATAAPITCGNVYSGFTTGVAHSMPANSCPFNGAPSTGGQNWWTYTAAANEEVTLSTCGATDFDVRLSVFTGTACGDLACYSMVDNSPGCADGSAQLSFAATSGTTYYIAVHGAGAAEGNYQMAVSCAPLCTPATGNDACASATPITSAFVGTGVASTGDNGCAHNDAPTACSGADPVQGVWYSFNSGSHNHLLLTPADNSDNAVYTATTVNYALYNGTCSGLGASGEVSCATDAGGYANVLNVTPNTDYRLLVYNSGGIGVEGTFGLTLEHPAGNDAEVVAITYPAPGLFCSTVIAPTVTLRNNGDGPLNTVQFVYDIDGGTPVTYNWSGPALAFQASTSVTLPAIAATSGVHTLNIRTTLPNGATDEVPANDAKSVTLNISGESLVVSIRTDANGGQTSWQIYDSFFFTVAEGGPYTGQNNTTINTSVCLPTTFGNCYSFYVFDSFGDGMCCANGNGYWELRGISGALLLRDRFEATPDGYQSPAAAPQAPGYINGHEFCLPEGPSNIMPDECGIFTNTLQSKVYCKSIPGASQYQFEFSNPDAGFRRFIAVPRNWVKFSEMVTVPLIPGVTYFARARVDQGAAGLADDHFGPGCEMAISTNLGCTSLIDDIGQPTHSCGVSKHFGGSDKIWARPITGATQYRFRFTNAGEGFVRIMERPSYVCLLNWVTLPLQVGATYDVQVDVLVNSVWSGFCGPTCQVTIVGPGSRPEARIADTAEGQLNMWPNPVGDGRVNLRIDGLTEEHQRISVELYDLFGKKVMTQGFENEGPVFNTILHLPNTVAKGVYLVNITINGRTQVQRLSVQ